LEGPASGQTTAAAAAAAAAADGASPASQDAPTPLAVQQQQQQGEAMCSTPGDRSKGSPTGSPAAAAGGTTLSLVGVRYPAQ
jgi:hypothetical protein